MKPCRAHGLKQNIRKSSLAKFKPVVNFSSRKPRQLLLFGNRSLYPDHRVGYISRAFIMCALPLSEQKNKDGSYVLIWKRENGNASLELVADPRYGLPYGKDRIFEEWLTRQSILQKGREIFFKDGKSMLIEMGLSPKGDNKKWLNEVINRFTHTSITYQEGNKFAGGSFKSSKLIEEMSGYYTSKKGETRQKRNPNQRARFLLGNLLWQIPAIPIDLNTRDKIGRDWSLYDLHYFLQSRLFLETLDAKPNENFTNWKPIRIPMRDYRKQCGVTTLRADKLLRYDLVRNCEKLALVSDFVASLDDSDVITIKISKPGKVCTKEIYQGLLDLKNSHDEFFKPQPLSEPLPPNSTLEVMPPITKNEPLKKAPNMPVEERIATCRLKIAQLSRARSVESSPNSIEEINKKIAALNIAMADMIMH